LLIAFNCALIIVCLAAAGGLGYLYNKFGDLRRIPLAHAITAEPEDEGEPQNFLIVGSDNREVVDADDPFAGAFLGGDAAPGQRSDTIMILRVDPRSTQAAMLSLPRDLWVPIAGRGQNGRINSAFNDGPAGLIDTIEGYFAIPIHHYVEVDFKAFEGLVNAVDGVPIYFPDAVRDRNSGLFVDNPGCVKLDGTQALAYARSRHLQVRQDNGRYREDPTADLGRISRQQDFIRRVLHRAVAKGVRNPLVLRNVVDVAIDTVTVDSSLSPNDILRLAMRFRSLDPDAIQQYTIPADDYRTNGGAAVLRMRDDEAAPILDVFRGVQPQPAPGSPVTPGSAPVAAVDPSTVQVHVLNGVGTTGLATEVREQLSAAGFVEVGGGNAENFDYERTTIRYATGQEAAAATLARYLPTAPVLEASDSVSDADLVLIAGADFTGLLDVPAPAPSAAGGDSTTTTTGIPAVPTTPSTTAVGYVPGGEVPCG
jgi:LCP family protein required for cell wall assembly